MTWLKRVGLAVVVATVVTGVTPAYASPDDRSLRPTSSIEVVRAQDHLVEVRSSEGVATARLDPSSGVVEATRPDGTTVTVQAGALTGGVGSAPSPTALDSIGGRDRVVQASSFTCSMVIYVVSLIHHYGWTTAAAIALAAGAAGAAVVAIVMALGVDVFLVWAGTRC